MREVILPICVLFVLATLLLPMPAVLIDFLLVANILLALVLLVSTLYVSNPLKLSSLPSILLLVTMYRLALNVSTTRLILSGKDPGELISAFGSVVVQGNLAVGVIIFLVITLVQFIVIAKGSERVAEVAARFTLDALPGKQMAIDADIRSGLLSVEEAASKRQNLQLESRFYGALDGSMKFVKGDAIAGLVITAINLIGGIALGIFMFDLGFGESVTRFSLYTVGDGLISQIPALLNSLAAGMVVTFVGHSEENDSLSKSLVDQIGQVRAVKLLIACLALILAFAPGLPTWPFLILGGVLAASGLNGLKKSKVLNIEDDGAKFNPRPPAPISILLGTKAIESISDKQELVAILEGLRQKLFNNLGLILLPPEVSEDKEPDAGYSIAVKGIKVRVKKHSDLNNEWLDKFNLELYETIYLQRAELVDDIMTRRILDYYDDYAPELIARVIPEISSVTSVTEVIRNLVNEEVSVRSFDLLLQALAEHAKSTSNTRDLLEHVRIALKRCICEQAGMFEKETEVYQLSPIVDLVLLQLEKQGKAIEADTITNLVEECRQIPAGSIIISARGSRYFLKECMTSAGLDITCLAVDELCSTAKWKVVGVVGEDYQDAAIEAEMMETMLA